MRHLCFAVLLLGLLCSCAHEPEMRPLYASRFYTEKDAVLPNGWHFREDDTFARPKAFSIQPNNELDEDDRNYDERANLFTVQAVTGDPAMFYYCGYYEIEDDSIIDVEASAAGKGSFSVGVELFDADKEIVGARHQGFDILPVSGDQPFKNYRYRLYFLANENRKARYARLVFIVDQDSTLTLRDISLNIAPYDVNRLDSTYIKFKEKEAKQKRK